MTKKKELRRQIKQLKAQLNYANQLNRDKERQLREKERRVIEAVVKE